MQPPMHFLGTPVPAALVARYNRPTPRYTSYPTAPHFADAFEEADYRAALHRACARIPRRGLSLYVHLPFCRQLCHYCGCFTKITENREVIDRYLEALSREIRLMSWRVGPEQRVRQIHWGGGTPTYLEPAQIETLMALLRRYFRVADDAEVSIEADPRCLTEAHLEAAWNAGFNRISFGVQDFDPRVQEAIGRVQPVERVEEAVRACRALGFESLGFDLIYGLPYQTLESYDRTIDQVLALRPDRLSVFSYAHVPWMKRHQRLIPEDALPAPAQKLRLFLRIAERLAQEGGYRHVGMDHFARPDDALCQAQDAGTLHRNFQGYSTHAGCDLVALGASSISQVADVYAQNVKALPAYYRALDEGRLPVERGLRLSVDDRRRRHVITRLMCDFRLDKTEVTRALGIPFDAYFDDALRALEPLERDGLVTREAHRIEVSPLGRLFIRNIAAAFDAYLPAQPAQSGANGTTRPRYSQAV